MTRPSKAAVLAVALALLAASCGDDKGTDDPVDPTSEVPAESTAPDSASGSTVAADGTGPDTTGAAGDAGTFPVTVQAANGEVSLEASPTRIVSLSPTATEMLFAIGAGDQVVAVDDQSNYPPEAAALATTLSGFTPSPEAVSGYEPDLVVMADLTEGIDTQLEALGIPLWSGPGATTFDDVYTQIEQLGVLTGHVAEAAALVGEIQADIAAATAELPERDTPLTYYHELDNTYYSVTSNTFVGQVYGLFGLHNIADEAPTDSDYPQLSAEFVVSQNPDLIFLADAGFGESPETVAARPAWGELTAVTSGGVIPLDADIASRWGPRIADFVATIGTAVAAVDAVPAG